jgi:hypothetical protein
MLTLSDPVMASLIGAGGTVLTALIHLRLSWKKELKERERGKPITKTTRRGPVILVLALTIGAAVGGFSLSQYLLSWRDGDKDALRAALETKLNELSASAARLEQARLLEREQIESGFRRTEMLRQADEGTSALVLVGPCKADAEARRGCGEQSSARIAVCARVPASATVKEVLLYTRLEESQQAWSDSRVQPGEDAGQARFQEKFYERPDSDGGKHVCQGFAHWDTDKSRVAKIQVKYSL